MILQNIKVLAFWIDSLSELQACIEKDLGYIPIPEQIKHIEIQPDLDDNHQTYHVCVIVWHKVEIPTKIPIEKDTMAKVFDIKEAMDEWPIKI